MKVVDPPPIGCRNDFGVFDDKFWKVYGFCMQNSENAYFGVAPLPPSYPLGAPCVLPACVSPIEQIFWDYV